jgi:hypothetical protein
MTEEDRSIFAYAFDSYTKSAYIAMLLFSIEGGLNKPNIYIALYLRLHSLLHFQCVVLLICLNKFWLLIDLSMKK